MSFFSRNRRPTTRIPCIGDGTAPVYTEVNDGQPRLVIDGTDNLFEFVQSAKEECSVYNLINRYQRGDVTALSRRIGKYCDVTGMPSNLMDAYAVMRDAQAHFDTLSPDIRSKFNNDFETYLEMVSSATAEQLKDYFGTPVATENIDVKEGDVNA